MIRAISAAGGAGVLAALAVSACAALDATSPSQPRSAIERADAAYGRIRTLAELALLAVPVGRGAAVRAWLDRADRALVTARLSRDLEQLRHLEELRRSADGLAAAVPVGPPGAGTTPYSDREDR